MSEVVGRMECVLCGHENGVKKSKTGRFTAVCRWQDGGCGSQLQTLTADAGMRILKKMKPLAKPESAQEDEKAPAKQETLEPCSTQRNESKAPTVGWGLL